MMYRIKCADGYISLKLKVYICVQHAHPDSTAILFRTQHHLNSVSGNQFAKQVLAARIKYYCPKGTIDPLPCEVGTYQDTLEANDSDSYQLSLVGFSCPLASPALIPCQDGYS
jgi:hypothetical protein